MTTLSNDELKNKLTEFLDGEVVKISARIEERLDALAKEDPDYYKILQIFGITPKEAVKMDKYHNIGRIIFRNLGGIMEKLTLTCLQARWGGEINTMIDNTVSSSPGKFGVDWLHEGKKLGYETKWRYATTDGTTKNKIRNMATQLAKDGFTPVFLTYYQSKRKRPLNCYKQIAEHFNQIGGKVYSKEEAWEHIRTFTEFDLFEFLKNYSPPEAPL